MFQRDNLNNRKILKARAKLSVDARTLKTLNSYLMTQTNLVQYFCYFFIFTQKPFILYRPDLTVGRLIQENFMRL